MKAIKMSILATITLLVTQSAMAMFTLQNDLARYDIDNYGRVINAFYKTGGVLGPDLLDVFTVAMCIDGQTVARTPGYDTGAGAWVAVPDTTTGVGIGTNYFATPEIGYKTYSNGNQGVMAKLRDTNTGLGGVTKSEIYLYYMLAPGKRYLDVRAAIQRNDIPLGTNANFYFYMDSNEGQVANIQAPTLLKNLPPMYQMDDVASNWADWATPWDINTTYAFRIEGSPGGLAFTGQVPGHTDDWADGNNATVWNQVLNDSVSGLPMVPNSSTDPAWAQKWNVTILHSEERVDARLEATMPEPGTMLLLTTGLLGLVGLRRKNGVKK